jgi:hypothetical protein
MKRLLIIVAVAMMFGGSNAMAQNYAVAINGGKPFASEVTIGVGQQITFDIYLEDAPGQANTGGVWVIFVDSIDKIAYVNAGRALTDGSEGVTGPWHPPWGFVANEPNGVGTIMIIVATAGASPDAQGDIIVARVTLECTALGDATIRLIPIPGFGTWGPAFNGWDDDAINAATPNPTLVVHQLIDPDEDDDGIPDYADNCPTDYNPNQEDTYPPQGNNIGDACDCEGNFDCDQDVDGVEVTEFLLHFGRGGYSSPCTNGTLCSGDFICDGDVDAEDVTLFLEDFGRGPSDRPCPACDGSAWCEYVVVPPKYLIDDSAGDGGKNFPMPQSITLNTGSTGCVDMYLEGADTSATSGGMWLDFKDSTADISYVSAGRALTDGSEGVTGPWGSITGAVTNEPDGVGTLMVVVGQPAGGEASPDGDGDIIVGQVCLRHDSTNDATIQIRTIPGFSTWGPRPTINDEDIIPGLFIIRQ